MSSRKRQDTSHMAFKGLEFSPLSISIDWIFPLLFPSIKWVVTEDLREEK